MKKRLEIFRSYENPHFCVMFKEMFENERQNHLLIHVRMESNVTDISLEGDERSLLSIVNLHTLHTELEQKF